MSETIHPRNTLNALSGGQFLYSTRSVLQTAYPHTYGHELRKQHGANKPPQLMAYLIETFTKPGMHVLDPMAGVGGTLIGAVLCPSGPRYCDGIEIHRPWIRIYEQIAEEFENDVLHTYCAMVWGDCVKTLTNWNQRLHNGEAESYDFVCFDPPYNIHLKQTMSGKTGSKYTDDHTNRRTDYDMRSEDAADVANAVTYSCYLERMHTVFQQCFLLLRKGRYLCFICQNTYQNGEYTFTHVDLAKEAQKAGFVSKGEIVWVPAGKRLRPYGYPYQWVPNPVHATIVVLYKPKK